MSLFFSKIKNCTNIKSRNFIVTGSFTDKLLQSSKSCSHLISKENNKNFLIENNKIENSNIEDFINNKNDISDISIDFKDNVLNLFNNFKKEKSKKNNIDIKIPKLNFNKCSSASNFIEKKINEKKNLLNVKNIFINKKNYLQDSLNKFYLKLNKKTSLFNNLKNSQIKSNRFSFSNLNDRLKSINKIFEKNKERKSNSLIKINEKKKELEKIFKQDSLPSFKPLLSSRIHQINKFKKTKDSIELKEYKRGFNTTRNISILY